MKFFKLLAITIVFSILSYSCSSDDSSNNNEGIDLANEQNKQEALSIPISNLESGIIIDGASTNLGSPPTPNSNLNLNVASNQLPAIQNVGFNLRFSTTETQVAGAYLQITDTENKATSSYFDIPMSSFEQARRSRIKKTQKSPFSKNDFTVEEGAYQINIDFNDAFPPGKFCGVLCIYDNENNISQPITICVEVEAWGGNNALVGTWIESGISEEDDTTQVICNNNSQINVPYDQIIREEIIATFSADGGFEVFNDEEYKILDYTSTAETCSASYSSDIIQDKYRETGKWAFNETENTLSIVAFSYTDLINPGESETIPEGELLLQSAKVQINGDTLTLTETYTQDGEDYIEIITLKRK
ncbi:hypothetical protein [Cognatitamlana onchidii]|uniref:hypothetical protein n=1 Tax=Cognatitamlana onchidii TaxID=2562860 RepID=UPI0010A5D65A|nr:hypothetical protein [Algibacter onchidii]